MLTLKIDDKEIEDIFVNQFHSDMQAFVASIKAAFIRKSEDDLSDFAEEIEAGFNSPVVEKSHEEIWKDLRKKYA